MEEISTRLIVRTPILQEEDLFRREAQDWSNYRIIKYQVPKDQILPMVLDSFVISITYIQLITHSE